MGLTLSVLRIKFYGYRLIARNIPSNEITALREQFCELPGSMLDKLNVFIQRCLQKFTGGD